MPLSIVAVTPILRATSLLSGSLYATSLPGDIVGWQWDQALDAPGHVRIEIALLSAFAAKLIAATGGTTLSAPIIPLLCEFSQDNGATVDVRFVLISAMRQLDPSRPLLVIDQDDLYSLYGVTGVDRVTFVNSTPQNVLNAPAGSVPRPPGSIGGGTWPYVKGLFQTIPGNPAWSGRALLQMTPVVDAALATLPLSIDLWAYTIQASLKDIAARLAGTWLPGDSAPFGGRGHVVPFSGDAARNALGLAMCVAVGRVGVAPRLTLDGNGSGPWDETITMRLAGGQLRVEPQYADLHAQTSMIGGISNHGISTGQGTSGSKATTITSCLAINTTRGGGTTNWDDNLPILGTSAGVYYHVCGSGFLVPMSQIFYTNALAYDPSAAANAGGTLYAATPNGVLMHAAQPKAPPQPQSIHDQIPSSGDRWVLAGTTGAGGTRIGITAPVEDVWIDGTTSPPTIFARCGGSTKKNGQGIDGVYCTPALAGDTSGTGQGYPGWSRVVHSGAPIAAGGTLAALYYVDRNKPDTVYYLQPGTTNAPQACVGIPAGSTITGIDTGVGYVYVRTTAGADGFFSIGLGNNVAVTANPDQSIRSSDGALVQLNKVLVYNANLAGEFVALLLATNAGLYRSNQLTGGHWSSPNATSGVGDFPLSFVAAGGPQTVLGRATWRIFAGDERSFLISHNAGDNWSDVLAEKLDGGPAWYQRARLCGALPWPDNTIGALGTAAGAAGQASTGGIVGQGPAGGVPGAGGVDPGGTGTVLAVPPDKGPLPPGFLRARRLEEHGAFTFRLTNLASPAPMAGIQFNELSALQANADVGAIEASDQLELVEFRFLAAASQARYQMTARGSYTTIAAVARDIAPTDLLVVNYTPKGWETAIGLAGARLYVQKVSKAQQAGGPVIVTLTLGTTLEASNLDPGAMAAAQAQRITHKIRWGSA